jgi:uncharacterized FlaG/YvyC family protein
MPNPDFSNDTKRLAARTRTLRALNTETVEESANVRPTDKSATVEHDSVDVDKTRPQASQKNQERLATTTIAPAIARWSNRMASLNTEIPFDMRELIDELYVTRRRIDKREGRKLTTYADLTTEAFELLLQKSRPTG